MKKEFTDKLKEKYPKILSGKYGGVCVGDGWFDLIDSLCRLIQGHIDNTNESRHYDIAYNDMVAAAKSGDTSRINQHLDFLNEEQRARRVEEIIRSEKPRKVAEEITQVVAAQIKEKFGGLRFYIDGGDDYIHGAITMAENLSYRICEECGTPGKTEGPGWYRTLCPTHHAERLAEQERRQAEWKALKDKQEEFTDEELAGALYDVNGVITEESVLKINENRKSKE